MRVAGHQPVAAKSGRPRLRSVALPAEHGGWGFLLEPILLGLLAAPSLAGLWLGLAALAVFLVHQPLKIAIKDWRKGKNDARTRMAWRFAIIYSIAGLVAFILALTTTAHPFWPSLLLALPFALIQLRHESSGRGRELIPEITGAVALLATAPAIAQAAGWSMPLAFGMWLILTMRTVISILYVRARLRLERGEAIQRAPVWISHVISLAAAAGMAAAQLIPWSATTIMALLLGRAALGLSSYRRPARAKSIGFMEIGYGMLLVAVAAVGYWLEF